MKKTILILGLIWIAFQGFSQQLPMYSQYMNNRFLLNPAVAGSEDYIPIRLTARQQWVGIENAPSTQALSGNLLIANQKIGVGGYVFADRFGADSKIGIQGSFAYILPVGIADSKLSMGLSFMAFQYAYNAQDTKINDVNDPTVDYNNQTAFVPDANFGIYWHNDDFFVGVSANQLIEFKVDFVGLDASKNTLKRHYFVMGGYKFNLSKTFDIEPSVMLKLTESSPMNFDLAVKGYYNKLYWFGVAYRTGVPFDTGNSMIAMLGAKFKNIVVGYAFDYTFTNLNQYTSGTHEIMLGINLKETVKKGSSLL
ncbi:MAG: type IX secretion system membrane protein PorP/SprF [Bacteroidales bacterium]|nr:type IX secretion system membrane protein PorP/SprF [Bacteroidales bacterium]